MAAASGPSSGWPCEIELGRKGGGFFLAGRFEKVLLTVLNRELIVSERADAGGSGQTEQRGATRSAVTFGANIKVLPKTIKPREGRPHCIHIETVNCDSLGAEKYVFDLGSAVSAQQCVERLTQAARAAKAAVRVPGSLHASGLRVFREEMDHTLAAAHTMMHVAVSATDLVLEPEAQAAGVAQPSPGHVGKIAVPIAACSTVESVDVAAGFLSKAFHVRVNFMPTGGFETERYRLDFGAREVDRNAVFAKLKAGPSPLPEGIPPLSDAAPAPAPCEGWEDQAARVIQSHVREEQRLMAALTSWKPIWQYDDHPRGWRTYASLPSPPHVVRRDRRLIAPLLT